MKNMYEQTKSRNKIDNRKKDKVKEKSATLEKTTDENIKGLSDILLKEMTSQDKKIKRERRENEK